MGRPKKKSAAAPSSIEECAAVMGDLLAATCDLEAGIAERDLAVASASQKFEAAIDEARERKSAAEGMLQAYYYGHIQEIETGGAKHVQLANGRFGRRDNPPKLKPLNRQWAWPAIKSAVRALWGVKYFHDPPEPELDKDLLKTVDADKLRNVGLKVEGDETFYAEPARLPAEVKP